MKEKRYRRKKDDKEGKIIERRCKEKIIEQMWKKKEKGGGKEG